MKNLLCFLALLCFIGAISAVVDPDRPDVPEVTPPNGDASPCSRKLSWISDWLILLFSPTANTDEYKAFPNSEGFFDGLLENDKSNLKGVEVFLNFDVSTEITTKLGGIAHSFGPGGSFRYKPPIGVRDQVDTFEYEISNGIGTATGTVEITLYHEAVWYVSILAQEFTGTGTSWDPFGTLSDAGNCDDPNLPSNYQGCRTSLIHKSQEGDWIRVSQSESPFPSGIALLKNQKISCASGDLIIDGEVVDQSEFSRTVIGSQGHAIILSDGNFIEGCEISFAGSQNSCDTSENVLNGTSSGCNGFGKCAAIYADGISTPPVFSKTIFGPHPDAHLFALKESHGDWIIPDSVSIAEVGGVVLSIDGGTASVTINSDKIDLSAGESTGYALIQNHNSGNIKFQPNADWSLPTQFTHFFINIAGNSGGNYQFLSFPGTEEVDLSGDDTCFAINFSGNEDSSFELSGADLQQYRFIGPDIDDINGILFNNNNGSNTLNPISSQFLTGIVLDSFYDSILIANNRDHVVTFSRSIEVVNGEDEAIEIEYNEWTGSNAEIIVNFKESLTLTTNNGNAIQIYDNENGRIIFESTIEATTTSTSEDTVSIEDNENNLNINGIAFIEFQDDLIVNGGDDGIDIDSNTAQIQFELIDIRDSGQHCVFIGSNEVEIIFTDTVTINNCASNGIHLEDNQFSRDTGAQYIIDFRDTVTINDADSHCIRIQNNAGSDNIRFVDAIISDCDFNGVNIFNFDEEVHFRSLDINNVQGGIDVDQGSGELIVDADTVINDFSSSNSNGIRLVGDEDDFSADFGDIIITNGDGTAFYFEHPRVDNTTNAPGIVTESITIRNIVDDGHGIHGKDVNSTTTFGSIIIENVEGHGIYLDDFDDGFVGRETVTINTVAYGDAGIFNGIFVNDESSGSISVQGLLTIDTYGNSASSESARGIYLNGVTDDFSALFQNGITILNGYGTAIDVIAVESFEVRNSLIDIQNIEESVDTKGHALWVKNITENTPFDIHSISLEHIENSGIFLENFDSDFTVQNTVYMNYIANNDIGGVHEYAGIIIDDDTSTGSINIKGLLTIDTYGNSTSSESARGIYLNGVTDEFSALFENGITILNGYGTAIDVIAVESFEVTNSLIDIRDIVNSTDTQGHGIWAKAIDSAATFGMHSISLERVENSGIFLEDFDTNFNVASTIDMTDVANNDGVSSNYTYAGIKVDDISSEGTINVGGITTITDYGADESTLANAIDLNHGNPGDFTANFAGIEIGTGDSGNFGTAIDLISAVVTSSDDVSIDDITGGSGIEAAVDSTLDTNGNIEFSITNVDVHGIYFDTSSDFTFAQGSITIDNTTDGHGIFIASDSVFDIGTGGPVEIEISNIDTDGNSNGIYIVGTGSTFTQGGNGGNTEIYNIGGSIIYAESSSAVTFNSDIDVTLYNGGNHGVHVDDSQFSVQNSLTIYNIVDIGVFGPSDVNFDVQSGNITIHDVQSGIRIGSSGSFQTLGGDSLTIYNFNETGVYISNTRAGFAQANITSTEDDVIGIEIIGSGPSTFQSTGDSIVLSGTNTTCYQLDNFDTSLIDVSVNEIECSTIVNSNAGLIFDIDSSDSNVVADEFSQGDFDTATINGLACNVCDFSEGTSTMNSLTVTNSNFSTFENVTLNEGFSFTFNDSFILSGSPSMTINILNDTTTTGTFDFVNNGFGSDTMTIDFIYNVVDTGPFADCSNTVLEVDGCGTVNNATFIKGTGICDIGGGIDVLTDDSGFWFTDGAAITETAGCT